MNPSKPYKSHSSCQWWVDDDNKRILAEVAFITRNVPIMTLTSPMIGEFYHPWESWSPKKTNQKTRWTVLMTILWILFDTKNLDFFKFSWWFKSSKWWCWRDIVFQILALLMDLSFYAKKIWWRIIPTCNLQYGWMDTSILRHSVKMVSLSILMYTIWCIPTWYGISAQYGTFSWQTSCGFFCWQTSGF